MGAAALPRAIGIVRVSRQNRDEDSRESPEVQRRLITRFAGPQGQGWDLIEILDENELRNGNVSGGGDIYISISDWDSAPRSSASRLARLI